MLPASNRLRDPAEFRQTIRYGHRAKGQRLIVYATLGSDGTHIGFIVSKAVGGAVMRNRVKRVLRHAMRARRDAIPSGTTVVVRALPLSARATGAELGSELDALLTKAMKAAA